MLTAKSYFIYFGILIALGICNTIGIQKIYILILFLI